MAWEGHGFDLFLSCYVRRSLHFSSSNEGIFIGKWGSWQFKEYLVRKESEGFKTLETWRGLGSLAPKAWMSGLDYFFCDIPLFLVQQSGIFLVMFQCLPFCLGPDCCLSLSVTFQSFIIINGSGHFFIKENNYSQIHLHLSNSDLLSRPSLYLGMVGIGLNVLIFIYTSMSAWSIRRFDEKWELASLSVLPIVTLLGLISFCL